MNRRRFLQKTTAAAGGVLFGARFTPAAGRPAPRWRTFEVVTTVELLEPVGTSRVWLPLPLTQDTDYFRRLGDSWNGNAAHIGTQRDAKYDAGMLYAQWDPSVKSPVVELTSRFTARDRVVNLSRADRATKEDPKVLKLYLQPTELIPTDGIVADTARQITQGKTRDIDKARAIYDWIVDNTFRDPKVKGCGVGDIRAMLVTGYFGGKCADLNALYVGLARAIGLPARDVYGVRVADSAEFKSLGKTGDITKAQHCRAEVYLAGYGWVPVDPADVRKVALEEKPGGLPPTDPLVRKAQAKLFGAWEMNWLPYNFAHDVKLPNSSGQPIPFLMYPQAETADGRKDSLAPESFRYTMRAREIPV